MGKDLQIFWRAKLFIRGYRQKKTHSYYSHLIYNIQWKENQEPYQAFSKRFEESPNPTEAFSAIMVCSEADEGCPFVPGTDFRIALPFKDPKAFDGTSQEEEKYDERCQQIGTEMLYVMVTTLTQYR